MKQLITILLVSITFCSLGQFSSFTEISKDMSQPISASADLDNDSDIDLVLIARGANKLRVYSNDGTGVFTETQSFNLTGPATNRLILGDVDNDGDNDLVTLVTSSGVKLVLYRNTAGVFGAMEVLYDYGNSFYAANFCFTKRNNDAYPEIAIDHDILNQRIVLINNNNGVYESDTTINQYLSMLDFGNHIESVDMDGDGDEDLITNKEDPTQIVQGSGFPSYSVWFENDNGNYIKHEYYIRGSNYQTIRSTMADLNGDGLPDYIVLNPGSYFRLGWFDNQQPPYVHTSGQTNGGQVVSETSLTIPGEILHADMNNDGDIDIIASNENRIFVFVNDGVGNFTNDTAYFDNSNSISGGSEQFHYNTADINADGNMDIVVTSLNDDDFFWLENDGNVNFTQHYIDYNASTPLLIYPTDYNEDGVKDIVSFYARKPIIHVFEGVSNTVFKSNIPLNTAGVISDLSNYQIREIDMDDDGDQDLFTENLSGMYTNPVLTWYERDGSNSFQTTHAFNLPENYIGVKVADMNNDGKKDLVMLGANVYVIFNQGNGNFGTPQLIYASTISGTFTSIHLQDMDGDNLIDIVTNKHSTAGYTSTIRYIKNLGNGNFSPLGPTICTLRGKEMGFGDLDGDGLTDIIGLNSTFGFFKCHWHKNNGNWNFGAAQQFFSQSNLNWMEGYVVDVDNDGDNDIVSSYQFNNVQNYTWNIIWHENNGSQTFVPHTIASNLPQLYSWKLDDYDFDGDWDIIAGIKTDKVGYYRNDVVAPRQLTGAIFIDVNDNGLKDAGDTGMDFAHVTLSPGALNSFTDTDGDYFFSVNPGTYQIGYTGVDPGLWELTTAASNYTATVLASSTVLSGFDFGFHPIIDSTSLLVDIASPPISCNQELLQFLTVRNNGSSFPKGVVRYDFDTLVTINTISPTPDSLSGNSIYWHFDSLFFFEQFDAQISFTTPGFTTMGDTFHFNLAVQTFDAFYQPTYIFEDHFSSIMTCAYDPNNKLAETAGYTEEGFITNDEPYIDYTINFQNTGTDTATNVLLVDDLSQYLDWNTLEVLSSSHHVSSYLSSNGRLKFYFNTIHLPDSGANLQGSKGFVKYRIKPDPNLVHGTQILNFGAIYFDQNPAILTNTVKHTIFDCLVMESGIQTSVTLSSLCVNDTSQLVVSGAYMEEVEWAFENNLISTNDTLLYQFPDTGTQIVQLRVKNPICTIDKLVEIELGEGPAINITPANYQVQCSTSAPVLFNSSYSSSVWKLNNQVVTTDSILTAQQSGIYVLEASSGNCITYDTVELILVSPPVFDISSNDGFVICDGNAVTLESELVNGHWYYENALIDAAQSIQAEVSGWYSVRFDSICSSVDSVFITSASPNLAHITASSALHFCEGDSVTLYSQNGTNVWSLNNVVLGSADTLSAFEAGWYLLTYTDTVCPSSTDSVFVQVESPAVAAIQYNELTICSGDSSTLWTSANSALQWTFDGTNVGTTDTLIGHLAGEYVLTIQNNFCPVSTDTVTVEVVNPVSVSIIQNDVSICSGDSAYLNSDMPLAGHQWMYNNQVISEASEIWVSQSGWYYLDLTNELCYSHGDSILINVLSLPAGPYIQYSAQSLFVNESSIISIQWFYNGEIMVGSVSDTIINPEDGEYTAEITFTNGCVVSETFTLNTLGQEITTSSNHHIYPIPTSDKLMITTIGTQLPRELFIYNTTGELISFYQVQPSSTISVDVSGLAAGVYYIAIKTDGNTSMTRMRFVRN